MNNVMLDLETMGNNSNSAIIAIGAVAFDVKGALGPTFYQTIDLATSVKNGGVMDASTVLWWMKQSDEARKEFEREGSHETDALLAFDNFLGQFEDVKIWGNGATFDNVILSNAYARNFLETPWSYRNNRCYRTIVADIPKEQFEKLRVKSGTAHNALDDAISQAKTLQNIFALSHVQQT